jgi:hypothetical protein
MAGLADVILGYVSGLLWALLTERTFLILNLPNLDGACNSRSVEYAYHYRFVDWSARQYDFQDKCLPLQSYECLLPPYDSGCPAENSIKVAFPGNCCFFVRAQFLSSDCRPKSFVHDSRQVYRRFFPSQWRFQGSVPN